MNKPQPSKGGKPAKRDPPTPEEAYEGVRDLTGKNKRPIWHEEPLTEEELKKAAEPFFNKKPITLQAVLTRRDIVETFTSDDKDAYEAFAHKFISGGLKIANAALSMDVAGDFFAEATDLATDLVKDKAIEQIAELGYEGGQEIAHGVMVGEKDDEGWNEWKTYKGEGKNTTPIDYGESAGKKLYKRLGTSILVVAIKILAGSSLVAVTHGAAVPLLLAVAFYFGDRANDEKRKMRIGNAEKAIEHYESIKERSYERIKRAREIKAERIILINAKHDWEDEHCYIIGEYWSYWEGRSKPITQFHLHDLEELIPDSGCMPRLHQAELWRIHRGKIRRVKYAREKQLADRKPGDPYVLPPDFTDAERKAILLTIDQLEKKEHTAGSEREAISRLPTFNPNAGRGPGKNPGTNPGADEGRTNIRGVNKNG